MDTWEKALHRFDDIAARDAQSAPSLQYSLPNFAHASNAAIGISDFTSSTTSSTSPVKAPPTSSTKFIGISSSGKQPKKMTVAQRKRSSSSVSSLAPANTKGWQKFGIKSKGKQKEVITHAQAVSVIESHPFLPFCK